MKKSTAVVISVIVAILVIAGCVWAYMHFTQKENVLPSPSGDVKQSGESIENKEPYDKEIKKIVNTFESKEPMNPHAVNPEYLKLTEAEESKLN